MFSLFYYRELHSCISPVPIMKEMKYPSKVLSKSLPIGGIILRKRNFRTITLFLLPESANGMWITGLQLINLP